VLIRLVASGRTYVKIASPYDSSRSGPPLYADMAPLVAALARAAPDRLVWASNWPHAALTVEQRPDDAAWLDLMADWMDETTRRKMLVDNPAKLFGF
jgi:D-galactarolactone isomerase